MTARIFIDALHAITWKSAGTTSTIRGDEGPAELGPFSRREQYSAFADAIPAMIGIMDDAGTLLYGNKDWITYTGLNFSDAGIPAANRLVHADDAKNAAALLGAMETHANVRSELRIRRSDGAYRWHEVRGLPLSGTAGSGATWMFTCTDIEDRIAAQRELARSAERDRTASAELRETHRLMAMAEQFAHIGHWRLDLTTDRLMWSAEVFKTFGLAPGPISFEAAVAGYHPDDRESVRAAIRQAIARKTSYSHESRVVRPDGTLRYIVSSGQTECDAHGSVIAVFGVFQDVTEAHDAQREQTRLLERIKVATQAARVGIWEWDFETHRIVWDPIMFALYGSHDAAIAPTYESWLMTLHSEDRARTETQLERALSGDGIFDTEYRIFWPDGSLHYIRAMGSVVYDSAASPIRMIGTNWDVSEVRTLADQLRQEKDAATFAATHDPLTGLLNRRGIEGWTRSHPGSVAALLYLDIDGFKGVNDHGGHAAGDETLRSVARIVRDAIRDGDRAARIGGDEFLLVLSGVSDSATIAGVSARISANVAALCPLGPGDPTRIGISIGAGKLVSGVTFSDAVREADADLYCRKNERRSAAAR